MAQKRTRSKEGKPLAGKVAVVAGATRGAGRGIARMLGEAGATVYCTGRSSRRTRLVRRKRGASPFALEGRPETIEETAELVTKAGGRGIAVRVDHTIPHQVAALFRRVEREQRRLDVLVNDIWGGEALIEPKPFWDQKIESARTLLERAVLSHMITSRYGVPLMVKRGWGLVVEITDGDLLNYRGHLLYDFVKTSVIRLAFAMAEELRPHNVASVAVTPGFLRSESMLEYFGVTEANWREGAKKDPNFIASETPCYVGRAIAALAADRDVMKKSGQVFASWTLAREYGFTDIDGSRPDFGRHVTAKGASKELAKIREAHNASNRRFLRAFDRDWS